MGEADIPKILAIVIAVVVAIGAIVAMIRSEPEEETLEDMDDRQF